MLDGCRRFINKSSSLSGLDSKTASPGKCNPIALKSRGPLRHSVCQWKARICNCGQFKGIAIGLALVILLPSDDLLGLWHLDLASNRLCRQVVFVPRLVRLDTNRAHTLNLQSIGIRHEDNVLTGNNLIGDFKAGGSHGRQVDHVLVKHTREVLIEVDGLLSFNNGESTGCELKVIVVILSTDNGDGKLASSTIFWRNSDSRQW